MLNKLTICLSAFLTFSCINSQKLARQFVQNENKPGLLYLPGERFFLEYYRFSDKTHPLFYYPEKLFHFFSDTELVALRNAYDSVMINSLQRMGFKVFGQHHVTDFFGDSLPGWIIQPVQMIFEEHRRQYQDVITFESEEYVWDTVLSEYQFCVWYEFTPVNQDDDVPVFILFAATSVSDRIEGYFYYDRNLGHYVYRYSPDLIDKFAFWQFVELSAHMHAQYTFDFFLNKYLHNTRTKRKKKLIYYTWDWDRQRLQQAYYRRFIFL